MDDIFEVQEPAMTGSFFQQLFNNTILYTFDVYKAHINIWFIDVGQFIAIVDTGGLHFCAYPF